MLVGSRLEAQATPEYVVPKSIPIRINASLEAEDWVGASRRGDLLASRWGFCKTAVGGFGVGGKAEGELRYIELAGETGGKNGELSTNVDGGTSVLLYVFGAGGGCRLPW